MPATDNTISRCLADKLVGRSREGNRCYIRRQREFACFRSELGEFVSFRESAVELHGLFPTAQVRDEIIPNILHTRLAYSTAIGRPAFSQVTAATVVHTGNLTITTGKPDLKPTAANNFEFTLEYTPTKDSYSR